MLRSVKPKRRYYALLLTLVFYLLLCSFSWDASQDLIDLDALNRILDDKVAGYMREVRQTKGNLMMNDTSHLEANQKALACFVDQGTWTRDDDSNQVTFQPDYSCLGKAPSSSTKAFALDLCTTISNQKVLLVGSEATHHLHTLWLDALDEDHTCLGPEFCTFHHVCLPPSMRTGAALSEPRFKKLPRDQDLAELGSALVRFSLSSSLLVPESPRVWSEVRVDPRTGVRARDSNWLEQARRSQVVVMNRGPVPAPASTYNVSDAPDASERWEGPWAGVLKKAVTNDYVGSGERFSRIERLVNAALDVTLRSMLPQVIETLARMREDDVVSKNTLIWHAAWYKQPQCACGKPSSSNVLSEVLEPSLDPWTLYHNLQVHMQNRIMPILMPSFGVAFMPLVPPLTEGDISHAAPARKRLKPGQNSSLSRAFNVTALVAPNRTKLDERRKRSDCIRYPGNSPGGRALQAVYLRSLDYLIASGNH